VQHTRKRPPQQPPLSHHVDEEGSHTRQRVIEATLTARGALHHTEAAFRQRSTLAVSDAPASRTSAIGLMIAVTAVDTSVPSTPAGVLHERGDPLPGIVGCEERDELAALRLQCLGNRKLRPSPHRSLGGGERQRCPRGKQLTPTPRRGGKLVRLDDLSNQADRQRAVSVDRVTGEQQLGRARRADQPRQALGAAPAGDDAELDLRLAEARGTRRDTDVACKRELAANPRTRCR